MIKGLPNKLKSLRIKYGYSQKQIAEKLHLSPSIISGYETGERTPSTEMLLSLSYIYSCSTDYLLGKIKNDSSQLTFNTDGLSQSEISAIVNLIEAIKGN